jgi:hypothetical protein
MEAIYSNNRSGHSSGSENNIILKHNKSIQPIVLRMPRSGWFFLWVGTMTNLFTELIKFFSEFTWRKLVAVIFMVLILVGLFSIYELYTSSFRFNRLQNAAELLIKLEQMESTATNQNDQLKQARTALITQATEIINNKPITVSIIPTKLDFTLSFGWFYKFVFGASFWFVIAVFVRLKAKNTKDKSASLGMLTFSVFTGISGMYFSEIWWPWFHIFILPLLSLVGLAVLVVPIGYFAKKKSERNGATQGTT